MATKAKDKSKDKRRMDTEHDPLADLGLDIAPTVTKAKGKPADKPAADTKPKADAPPMVSVTIVEHHDVIVGEIELGFSDYVPASKRKSEGTKYPFDKLVAPGVWADGPNKGKPKIANFFTKLADGETADKLKRSVQSATTQANKHGAAEGKYFASRSKTVDGKFVGMIVLRTDARPTKE